MQAKYFFKTLFLLAIFSLSYPKAFAQTKPDILAIENVNVIPMDREVVLKNHTVLIQDGKITALGKTKDITIPKEAQRIDGTGKYLMPGLVDMHVHFFDDSFLKLFLKYGVTTVRNMWGESRIQKWRKEIANGTRIGPTIYSASELIDGPTLVHQGAITLKSPAGVDALIRKQKQAGYEFIKIYDNLSSETYQALIQAGQKYGMPVIGHIPTQVGLSQVLKSHQSSIEHLFGYFEAMEKTSSPYQGKTDKLSRWKAASYLDLSKLPKLAEQTANAGAWNVPTLVAMKNIFAEPSLKDEFFKLPAMQDLPEVLREQWQGFTKMAAVSKYTKEDFQAVHRGLKVRNQIVKALHKKGARLLLGTDTPNPFVIPGYAAHEELQLLVKAGLSPYEALRTATVNAGEYLKSYDDGIGAIAVGKNADLILLNKNPLSKITNISVIEGVIVQGKILSSLSPVERKR